MPRVIEIKQPYLKDGFLENNKFWDNDNYSESSKRKIEKSLNVRDSNDLEVNKK